MSARIYIEGAESKQDQIRCREGFRKLLEQAGFAKRMPRLTACGSRGSAFDDFKTAHSSREPNEFVALLIDSEDPVADTDKTWAHLKSRPGDNWDCPPQATDEQVFLMTTCMETWILGDRPALRAHYGQHLQETALPPLTDLEKRPRHDVHDKLTHATRNCTNAYAKGKRSFVVLGTLNPETLRAALPSFARMIRILTEKL